MQEFGKTPKDLDFEKLQRLARRQVALQYGVPIPLVDSERATMNNMEQSNEMLFDNGVEPLIKQLLDGLKFFLFPRFGLDMQKFDLTFDRTAMPILRKRFIKELNERVTANVETSNELRQLINREPLAVGADELYRPVTMMPIASDVFTDDDTTGRDGDEATVMDEPEEED